MTRVAAETRATAVAILTRAANTAGPFPRDRAADELNAPMEARWLSYNAWSAYANMPALSLREQYAKAAARLQTGWTP